MTDLYREEILEHWQNPQNFGVMSGADVIVEQVNPLCGDEITMYIRFKRDPLTTLRVNSGAKGQSRRVYQGEFARDTSEVGPDSSEVEKLRIADVSFTGSGCAISVASASILSEAIKGKKLKDLERITGQDILGLIGGNVAPARLKCAFLALEAIKKLASRD